MNIELLAKTYTIIAEIEGMKAENMQREACGESMAYVAKDFNECAAQLAAIIELPIKNKHSPQELLPEKGVLVVCKRLHGSFYIGLREDKPLATDKDTSRDCFWHGTDITSPIQDFKEEGHSDRSFDFKASFSDVTVEWWCYLSDFFIK